MIGNPYPDGPSFGLTTNEFSDFGQELDAKRRDNDLYQFSRIMKQVVIGD